MEANPRTGTRVQMVNEMTAVEKEYKDEGFDHYKYVRFIINSIVFDSW